MNQERHGRLYLITEQLEPRKMLAGDGFGDDNAGDPITCSDLESIEFPGVTQLHAREIPSSGNRPSHCRVFGKIDETIQFNLRIPIVEEWNGKFFMFGNGGFAGSIQNDGSLGLERGYATAATNTGHSGSGTDGRWALGDLKAQENFGYLAVHLTAVTSKQIIEAFSNETIEHSYFQGCSTGGRQAMMESQRYPGDFDGIIAGAPAADWIGLTIGGIWNQQVMYPDPSDLSQPVVPNSKLDLLSTAVREKCDAIDGLEDGLIDDPRQCNFSPASDLPLCPDNVDGPSCFTSAQVSAIRRVYEGPVNSKGRIYPGFPPGVEDAAFGWDPWITDGRTRVSNAPNAQYAFAQETMRYFVFSDPAFEIQTFNFETDVDRTERAASILNATEPDLSPFKNAGGKMIMYADWADHAVTALHTVQYYEGVTETMGGKQAVDDFLRLFLLPGVTHCGGGPGLDDVDWLTALEQWVEEGIMPDSLVASKGRRTRPVCPYPERAVWDGAGEPDVAFSFTCLDLTAFTPGDANRDLAFNQLDIVQVLASAKYLTGEPATWSRGDWNADGVFDHKDIVEALVTGNYLQGPYVDAAIAEPGE